MSKLLCEYGERTEERGVKCSLTGQGCKYVRYCTQDSYWWCSDKFYKCGRRKSENGKKKNKISDNVKENINIENSNFLESNIVNITDVIENNEKSITEASIIKQEEVENKNESKPIKNKATLRRVIY